MKRFALSILLSAYVLSSYATENLAAQIDKLLANKLPHAVVGIVIKEAKTDKVLYSKNPELLFVPASNAKLFTAVAALSQFKPETTFATSLAEKDDNIYITFEGSPSLTIAQFNSLLSNLKAKHIDNIKGNIVIDESRFTAPYYPVGSSYDDQGWYYTPPTTTIMLNENAEDYVLTHGLKSGDLVSLKPKKPNPQLHLINELVSVTKEEAKNHCTIDLEVKDHNTVRLYGCIANKNNSQDVQLAITDPIYLATTLIENYLKQNQIHLQGKIITGTTPKDAKLIASQPSDNMAKLLKHMLQASDNIYADAITRQLAYAANSKASTIEGVNVINKILTEQYQLDKNQFHLYDGIGTRYNLVTPEVIINLLTKIYQDPKLFALMLKSLPQSSVSGTLKDRFKKTILEKNVYAKTGTMHDITALGGYLVIPNHDPLIFSIMINGVTKPIHQAKALEENILLLTTQSVYPDLIPASTTN